MGDCDVILGGFCIVVGIVVRVDVSDVIVDSYLVVDVN